LVYIIRYYNARRKKQKKHTFIIVKVKRLVITTWCHIILHFEPAFDS